LSFGYCFTPTYTEAKFFFFGVYFVTFYFLFFIFLNFDHWPNTLTNCANRTHRRRRRSLVIAILPHTPKYIEGGWSHYTDTSEPVDGYNGALNMVTVQFKFRTSDLSITGPTCLQTALTGPAQQQRRRRRRRRKKNLFEH
jgi:hypothetical protein